MANREVLIPLIRQATVLHTTAEWILSLERAGVPCGPINDLAQVFADPQVQARGLRVELPHPLAGTVPQVASPIRLSETPVEYRNPPPTLGQHTDEVPRRLGLDAAALERLRDGKVIEPRAPPQRRLGGQRPPYPAQNRDVGRITATRLSAGQPCIGG